MKEVTKEDDDARVGSESRRIQIFSVMEELSKQLSLIYHLFSANRLPVNMSFLLWVPVNICQVQD